MRDIGKQFPDKLPLFSYIFKRFHRDGPDLAGIGVFDELLAEKHDRMCDLIAAPAPSLAAFAIKVELVCREYLAWDPAERGIADALTADARRLIRR